MSKERIIDLGAIPQHAIPAGLSFQFLDGDGQPADMSQGTWSGQGRAEQLYIDGSQPSGVGSGAVTVDALSATGTYAWSTEDLATLGVFRLVIWAGNGTNRYGSPTFEYEVYDAPGVAPTV